MIRFVIATFIGFFCYLFLASGLSRLYDLNGFNLFGLDPLVLYSLAMLLVSCFESFFLDKLWWASGLLVALIFGYFSTFHNGDKTGIATGFALSLLKANILAAVLGSIIGRIVRKKCVRRSSDRNEN